MTTWKKYKLGETAIDISYGYTASANHSMVGPKFLRITDIQDDFINWLDVPYCNINQNDYLKNKLEVGDLVIARTGNSTGASALIKQSIDAVFASYLIRFRLDKNIADPEYVDFILRSKYWSDWVNAIKGGSAQPGANAKQFANFDLNLPPLPAQNRIAEILSALDDKIELNLQMNKTLEEMAMALYKHWFVDFGPFKDSEFVDSELGPIPMGWEVKTIGEIVQLKYGKALKEVNRVPGDYPVFGSSGIVGTHETYLIDGPSVIIGRKGNVGTTYWENSPCFPIDTVYYINSIPLELLRFMYLTFKNLDFLNRNSDSVVPGLNRDLAHSEKIVIPTLDILCRFETIASGYYNQIFHIIIENKSLIRTRDYLLPKLISGEVEVN